MGRPHHKIVIPNDEIGDYHIHNRCVRGAFLIRSRDNNWSSRDPRKDWIQTQLAHLCQGFAVEARDFSIMDNHFHLILRNRPDVVSPSQYSNEEAARRWWHLRPLHENEHGLRVEPNPWQLNIWLGDATRAKRGVPSC